MARKKRKPRTKPKGKGPAGWGFVLGALGFGLLCIAAGVMIIVFGGGYEQAGAEVAAKDVSTTGYWLIALGVVAMGLTIFIYRSRR